MMTIPLPVRRTVARLCLVVLSFAVSYRTAYYMCERYFFDEVFYRKSIAHGYWVQGKQLKIEDFGNRSEDVRGLFEHLRSDASVLGVADENEYTIAMIGDSYVWGQGVRFEDTVSQVLERKLGTVRKTNVLALATSGDDMIENLAKYRAYEDKNIDLFVFILVNNDVLLNLERKYSGTKDRALFSELNEVCYEETEATATGVFWSDWDVHGDEYYKQKMADSYANPANQCILNRVVSSLPINGAIYFIPDDRDAYLDAYVEVFRKQGMYLLDMQKAQTNPRYRAYFSDPNRYFWVSAIEDHPSVLAHRMYADLLAEEILSNPRWKFDSD